MAAGWVIAGVVLGFLLGEGSRLLRELHQRRACWAVIRAAMIHWRSASEEFLADPQPVLAPLGRLPLDGYEDAFKQLLAAGELSEGDQMALYEHLAFAQQFNAALDLAVAALGDDRRLHDEYGRARLKAERLAGEHAVHRVAFAVVEEALREPYVRRAMRLYSGRPSGGQA
jgi:hypothetical protein